MPHDEHVISDNFFYSDEHVHHRVGLVKIEYQICSPLILRNSITLLAIATAISFLKIFPIILYTKVPLCSFGTSTKYFTFKNLLHAILRLIINISNHTDVCKMEC